MEILNLHMATLKRVPFFFTGTYDFYGVNHYTSKLVRKPKPGESVSGWPMSGSDELGVVLDTRPEWESTTSWWFKVCRFSFNSIFRALKYGEL